MVTEGKIEKILCISFVSYSQINSQLPFKVADISPVAMCPQCCVMKKIGGEGWKESRMGKYVNLRKG